MSDSLPRIIGISGSLRRQSYNSALLRTAGELAGDLFALHFHDISDFPLFNEDVRAVGYPPMVETLRQMIRSYDGILFATPEYNRSIPGVLKNVLDWTSQAPDPPFDGVRVGMISATNSGGGGIMAQHHLRQILAVLNADVMAGPEINVTQMRDRFDAAGRLTHEPSRESIRAAMVRFAKFIAGRRKLNAA